MKARGAYWTGYLTGCCVAATLGTRVWWGWVVAVVLIIGSRILTYKRGVDIYEGE